MAGANRLGREKSPCLLQHAHNPVDWHPWGTEAFTTARARDVPVFLSIGYAACHWCHVMERKSFADPAVARVGSLATQVTLPVGEPPDPALLATPTASSSKRCSTTRRSWRRPTMRAARHEEMPHPPARGVHERAGRWTASTRKATPRTKPATAGIGKQIKYGAAKVLYGEYPPDSGLNYVWESRTRFASPPSP